MRRAIYKTAAVAAIASMVMFSFSFALAPLYNVFCKVTGFSSSVRIPLNAPDLSRTITVQFVATNNQSLNWEFYPGTTSIDVHPEQNTRVVFHAKNNMNKTVTVQAIPSFAPRLSALNFHKIQCFCFNQQTLKAGEAEDMPIVFRIDKKLPSDIHTITLAYTLFEVKPLQRTVK